MPSSVISAFDYEPDQCRLTVLFTSGRIYVYDEVPADVNRLNNQVLVHYYEEEWRRWKQASDTRPKGVPIKKILTAAVCTAFLALPLARATATFRPS